MFQVDNFIAFHDLTPEAQFLWASSSIVNCLGYEPDEVVGMNAYDAIHKDDIEYVKVTHTESVLNEMVGTQLLLRMRHKNGTYVPCMVLFSLCYEFIVSCYTVVDQSEGVMRKVSAHSAAMTSLVGSKKQEFERIRRHHQAFRANTWNTAGLALEPRACMLLNRFTRNLSIMYASPSCQLIFGFDPDDYLGKPFLLYIRADDLISFVDQVEAAKSSTVVTHMRFWFQSPVVRQEIPCEAMIFGAADGLIVILRRCKPFSRRQLITAGVSTDYFASESSVSSSITSSYCSSNLNKHSARSDSMDFSCTSNGTNNNNDNSSSSNRDRDRDGSRANKRRSYTSSHNYSSSTCGLSSYNENHNENHNESHCDDNDSDYYHKSPFGDYNNSERQQKVYYIDRNNRRKSHTASTLVGSPTDSLASSYSSEDSACLSGTRAYRAPLRGVPIGSINSIRNLDKEHNRLRPLTSLHNDESDIVDSVTALPEIYRLRKHQIPESEVDESGLEIGIQDLDISDDEEEGNNGVIVISDDDDDVEEILMPPPPRRRKDAKGERITI